MSTTAKKDFVPARSRDVVVTPIWRPELDGDERWNVTTTVETMQGTDHVLLAPRGLDTRWYAERFAGSRIVRGADAAFQDVWNYSRAMLDARLYRAFGRYRFMILAQTDAFLLRDLIGPLTTADWDYAGAPFSNTYRMSALTTYSRRLGEVEQRLHPRRICRIGNGGLSVRRIAVFSRVLSARPALRRFARMNEDLVLADLGERRVLRLCTREQADRLFFDGSERDPLEADVYGFHALQQKHPDAYRVISARAG